MSTVALPGAPTGVRVPLDLRVTLSGAFVMDDLLSDSSLGYVTFSAVLAPHFPLAGPSAPMARSLTSNAICSLTAITRSPRAMTLL